MEQVPEGDAESMGMDGWIRERGQITFQVCRYGGEEEEGGELGGRINGSRAAFICMNRLIADNLATLRETARFVRSFALCSQRRKKRETSFAFVQVTQRLPARASHPPPACRSPLRDCSLYFVTHTT